MLSPIYQRSTALPLAKRRILIPVKLTFLPVGGIPVKPPVSVPCIVKRYATLSPSAMISSRLQWKSGKVLREPASTRLTPSRLGVSPCAGYLSTKSSAKSSSITSKFPLLTSEMKRFNIALFCCVDILSPPCISCAIIQIAVECRKSFTLSHNTVAPGCPAIMVQNL